MCEAFTIALVLLGLFLLFKVVKTILTLIWRMLFGGGTNLYSALMTLARKRQGRCESRGVSDPPIVTFHHGQALVRVGLAPALANERRPSRTRVVVRFADPQTTRLELIHKDSKQPFNPPRGTRRVDLANHPIAERYDFDPPWILAANDPELANLFLTDLQVQQALDRLLSVVPSGHHLLVTVNPERLMVQVGRPLNQNFKALDLTTTQALLLYDRLLEAIQQTQGRGVKVLEGDAAETSNREPPICQFCGEPIQGDHVRCQQCHTPHHADCWDTNNGCSIFSCKCRQMVVVKVPSSQRGSKRSEFASDRGFAE
jgi:hypothetical protein